MPYNYSDNGNDDFAELEQHDDKYKNTKPSKDGIKVPDGEYKVLIERAELKRSQSAGNPMLSFMLRIIDGNWNRYCVFKHVMLHNLADDRQMGNFRWDMTAMGMGHVTPSKLKANVDAMVGIEMVVTVKTRGEYQNVTFERRTDQPEPTIDDPKDQIPF
jgi:hypothetical protein